MGRRINSIRTSRHMTQQELANTSGLDRTYISMVEHGKQNLTIGAVLRIRRCSGRADRTLDRARSRLVQAHSARTRVSAASKATARLYLAPVSDKLRVRRKDFVLLALETDSKIYWR